MRIVTLGRLAVEHAPATSAKSLLSQPKRLAVLIYVMLAQRGSALSRDRLLAVFWPESDSTRARNALRQTISFIRTCLGPDAILGVGTQALLAAPHLACDVVQFETLLDAGRREDALRLFGGELLPGFHVTGAPEFVEWLDARREYLAQRAAKAAWDLSAECESRGDISDAAFWGKRALALSPFSESEVQRLLRLLDRIDDFAGAMRAYHGLERALQSEFGVNPSAETTRIAAAIRARYDAEAAARAASLGMRRTGTDRRVRDRRIRHAAFAGSERRVADRRTNERRSGRDRRAP